MIQNKLAVAASHIFAHLRTRVSDELPNISAETETIHGIWSFFLLSCIFVWAFDLL